MNECHDYDHDHDRDYDYNNENHDYDDYCYDYFGYCDYDYYYDHDDDHDHDYDYYDHDYYYDHDDGHDHDYDYDVHYCHCHCHYHDDEGGYTFLDFRVWGLRTQRLVLRFTRPLLLRFWVAHPPTPANSGVWVFEAAAPFWVWGFPRTHSLKGLGLRHAPTHRLWGFEVFALENLF